MILLTGATGFVGKKILNELIDKDIQVVVVIRPSSRKNLIHVKKLAGIIESYDIFHETASWWKEKLTGIEKIIHSAWYAEPGKYLQSEKNIECLTGTIELAKAACWAGVKRFIGIGTCFEYDVSKAVLSTDTPLKPETLYASAKASTFFILNNLFPKYSVEFAWCRLFYLYGEGEDPRRLVAYIRKQISNNIQVELTMGNQIRDYLDVSEAAKMIVDVALKHEEGAINISSGIPITIRQLAERIADEYGRRDLLLFGKRKGNLMDPFCIVGNR